jgi:hypothetical protein
MHLRDTYLADNTNAVLLTGCDITLYTFMSFHSLIPPF